MPCNDKKKLIFFSVLAVSGMYKIFKIKKKYGYLHKTFTNIIFLLFSQNENFST